MWTSRANLLSTLDFLQNRPLDVLRADRIAEHDSRVLFLFLGRFKEKTERPKELAAATGGRGLYSSPQIPGRVPLDR